MSGGHQSDHPSRCGALAAAQQIVADRLALHAAVRTTAEGFATLDFAQGTVAVDLPTDTAWGIVSILRGGSACNERHVLVDLVDMWLQHYRRAYSCIVMRVLEHGTDYRAA